MSNSNIFPQQHLVTIEDRISIKQNKPIVLWLTGLSGSGKSTIANELEYQLVHKFEAHTYLLDGDNIRGGLNSDLDFSPNDRQENIRRIGEVCKLMFDAGLIVITSFISPYQQDRQSIRNKFDNNEFWEIYLSCPIEICIQRDPKGLYKKAISGEINNFTGINAPYEIPKSPEITLESHNNTTSNCVEQIIKRLLEYKIISRPSENQ
jgi:adenylylsulfate kinase